MKNLTLVFLFLTVISCRMSNVDGEHNLVTPIDILNEQLDSAKDSIDEVEGMGKAITDTETNVANETP